MIFPSWPATQSNRFPRPWPPHRLFAHRVRRVQLLGNTLRLNREDPHEPRAEHPVYRFPYQMHSSPQCIEFDSQSTLFACLFVVPDSVQHGSSRPSYLVSARMPRSPVFYVDYVRKRWKTPLLSEAF